MKLPTLEELLDAGVHFGHKVSKWHPKAAPYIYGNKNGVHIINLEKTSEKLEEALNYVKKLVQEGKIILFLGTKEQGQELVKNKAQSAKMPYVISHWTGGLFTNFEVVSKQIKKLKKLEADKESGKLKKYTKKEQIEFDEQIKKLEEAFGGLKNLEKLPEAIFVIDVKREKTAIREAERKGIPIVALVDTNINPEQVSYPIPANDDAIKSLELMVSLVAEAVKEGQSEKDKANQ